MPRNIDDLRARLSLAMAADAARLARRIDRARAPADVARLEADLARSIARVEARARARPAISYPA